MIAEWGVFERERVIEHRMPWHSLKPRGAVSGAVHPRPHLCHVSVEGSNAEFVHESTHDFSVYVLDLLESLSDLDTVGRQG